ncbi:MAG: TAXI family TRAP transporter solute-binding subunit [Candidatus Riflebacteria bacterium]|nr:TAXI family TRAP transporter solute-binding subunit [Candidatus Riflebacteria bacterium]
MRLRWRQCVFVLCVFLSAFPLIADELESLHFTPVRRFFGIGTASINGAYFPLGAALARLFNAHFDDIMTIAEPTSGSLANLEYLRSGDLALALVQSDLAWDAFHGLRAFAGHPFSDLRVLTALHAEVVQVAVAASSSIRLLGELRGHRIVVGERGSGSAINASMILETLGLSSSDYSAVYLPFTKATAAIADSEADAVFFTGAAPSEGFTNLAARLPIRLLSFTSEQQHRLTETYPFWSAETVPAGLYGSENPAVSTVGLRALLVTRASLDSATVEEMLKLLFGNLQLLASMSHSAAGIRLENALKSVETGMLHEGARNYFIGCNIALPASR